MRTFAEGPRSGTFGVALTRRTVVAGAVGNFIEWYEFGVYAFFATVIAANFFTPQGGGAAEALVTTYASFALAFFFRPVGAFLLGRVGDRFGRRPALTITVLAMTSATTLIGLLPTYAIAGAAAPWLLTALRIVQGLSAGGEFGGVVALMTECAPPGKRGAYGAWQSLTVALGLLAGAGAATLVTAVLTEGQVAAWGWRLPFLAAAPMGAVALCLRLRLGESPEFFRARQARAADAVPAARRSRRAWRARWEAVPGPAAVSLCAAAEADASGPPAEAKKVVSGVVLGCGRLMAWSAAGYTFLVVLPTYLQHTVGESPRRALLATLVANLGFAASILPAGALSDHLGRKPVMATGAAMTGLSALPLLHVVQYRDSPVWLTYGAVALAGALVGLLAGPGPAMLAEMFPTPTRHTGLGVAYALANAVFSGCAGLFITELIRRTGNPDVPAYYVLATSALGTLALATMKDDDHRRRLGD
ncbi:putative major facilitator superfamily transporter [Streptomyces sp. NBRC 110611]|uniref:MFS transporter n=1 Tax=Streptomyces sp. NBRC 110611 TaxID=1621259 RepID=UPI0008572249|nr:MFS transporter [Streptomyces sp. NBRC 110611]GAU65923.1 putative major facilitator superfamily transporter [Streptomyces sp. NBRC 110611]